MCICDKWERADKLSSALPPFQNFWICHWIEYLHNVIGKSWLSYCGKCFKISVALLTVSPLPDVTMPHICSCSTAVFFPMASVWSWRHKRILCCYAVGKEWLYCDSCFSQEYSLLFHRYVFYWLPTLFISSKLPLNQTRSVILHCHILPSLSLRI